MPALSPRLTRTAAPAIPTARAWAAAYDGAAGPALDLTQAVPGYPPPDTLLARLALEAGRAENAGYGPIDGDPALRAALADDATAAYGTRIDAADVAITAGCNLAFHMTTTVLAGDGGAVMLPLPWYFNHRMALEMAGIPCIPLPRGADDAFLPDPRRAAATLDANPTIRALVLVSPDNPTGAVCPPALIAAFAALCRERGVWLVLDETYRDFLPPGPPHGLFAEPDWRDGIVHLYSFSKAYCVPGHRLGAIIAGGAFRAALMKALDTLQICPNRAAQAALSWAVPALADWRRGNAVLMAERARVFAAAMAGLPDWRVGAMGAYFAWVQLPDAAPDAMEAAEALAARHGLLTLPGPFFGPGHDRHLRLAFANVAAPALAAVPDRLARLSRG